ncbi:reverse transcriptase domain-containing protein [Pedobacter panaciterrae]
MGPEISFRPHKKNMNFNNYEKTFRKKAERSGFSEDNIVACLQYAEPIIQKKLPVIFNTANLAALVGYKTTYLKRAVRFTPYFYRKFLIKKRSGGMRELVEPLPSLKEIQDWILNNLLYEIKVSRYAKAYVRDRSLIENVKYHRNKNAVLALDIIDFFGSITLHHVEEIFLGFGYSSNVANLLAKLCTFDGVLPQGAPTSPYLSNLFLKSFDETVAVYCVARNIRYTRYADDLTFSGDVKDLDIEGFIEVELNKLGLYLRKDKTKLMERNQRQIVTGIVVNDKIQIPKSNRNFIRNEVHYLTKFGLEEHLKRTKNKKTNYLQHLMGKINFALHINPEDRKMHGYKASVKEIIEKEEK